MLRSHVWVELDRDLQTMTLQIERPAGQEQMVGFRWTNELGSMLDNFMHMDASASEATGGVFFTGVKGLGREDKGKGGALNPLHRVGFQWDRSRLYHPCSSLCMN